MQSMRGQWRSRSCRHACVCSVDLVKRVAAASSTVAPGHIWLHHVAIAGNCECRQVRGRNAACCLSVRMGFLAEMQRAPSSVALLLHVTACQMQRAGVWADLS